MQPNTHQIIDNDNVGFRGSIQPTGDASTQPTEIASITIDWISHCAY